MTQGYEAWKPHQAVWIITLDVARHSMQAFSVIQCGKETGSGGDARLAAGLRAAAWFGGAVCHLSGSVRNRLRKQEIYRCRRTVTGFGQTSSALC